MKVVVGLGNPGRRYRGTRHNVGFDVMDELARRGGIDFEPAPTLIAATLARLRRPDQAVLLVKPQTFVNRSGEAVSGLLRYFKVDLAGLLIVVDEVQLPLGRVRARRSGSAGGHNGLRSVIDDLGTEAFSRLRIGVGRGDGRRDLADHVLARFEPHEREALHAAVSRAADAAELFIEQGIEAVMNRFNRSDVVDSEEEVNHAQGDL